MQCHPPSVDDLIQLRNIVDGKKKVQNDPGVFRHVMNLSTVHSFWMEKGGAN